MEMFQKIMKEKQGEKKKKRNQQKTQSQLYQIIY